VTQRWRTFCQNMPRGERIKTLLFCGIFLAITPFFFKETRERVLSWAAFALSLAAPYLFRETLIARFSSLMKLGRALPYVLTVGLFFASDWLKREPARLTTLVVVLGLWVGALFWTFSDRRAEELLDSL
jgi:hypothetical protein